MPRARDARPTGPVSGRSGLSWPRVLLSALLAAVLVLVSGVALLRPDPPVDRMQIVLAPHPDDEFLAFPALPEAPGTYTVLVTLTRGERSSRCDDVERYLQEDAGEDAPDPLPEADDAASCARARLDSWHSFLDAAAGPTRAVRLGPAASVEESSPEDTRFGGSAEVRRGRDGARVVLSLPDGELTEASSARAVEALLGLRGDALPDLPVARVLLASYWNDAPDAGVRVQDGCAGAADCPGDPDAVEYEHPDHRALTLAAPAIAAAADADTWVSVPPDFTSVWDEPEVALERRALDPDAYAEYLGLGPAGADGPERVGILQSAYGWLATPGQWWTPGETTASGPDVLYAREQTYAIVEAP